MAFKDGKQKKEAKPIKYKFPKTIGACLARLATIQTQAAEIMTKATPLMMEEKALRDYMLEAFKKDELKGARGSGLALSIVKTVVPKLNDWATFFAFAKKKGNEDLLQQSVKTDAWRARVDAGKEVPGVETFTNVGLRVNKIKEEE